MSGASATSGAHGTGVSWVGFGRVSGSLGLQPTPVERLQRIRLRRMNRLELQRPELLNVPSHQEARFEDDHPFGWYRNLLAGLGVSAAPGCALLDLEHPKIA